MKTYLIEWTDGTTTKAYGCLSIEDAAAYANRIRGKRTILTIKEISDDQMS